MKIYSEEQVRSLLDKMSLITERKKLGVSANFRSRKIEIDDLIKSIDSIELPSDEVIRGQLECTESEDYIAGKCTGMFFVINHIKQQNNDKDLQMERNILPSDG